MSGGEPLVRSVSTSTNHRVPCGRGSFLPSSSPLASRRLTVAVERPKIRDASVTVSSAKRSCPPTKNGPSGPLSVL